MNAPGLCTTPNQHARPAGLELTDGAAAFRGYQDFVLTRDTLAPAPHDVLLARKHALLAQVLQPALVSRRTVLDLGANSAFFAFLALQHGADAATAVDLDPVYVDQVRRAARSLGFERMTAAEGNVADWREPADVVIALALVHWLYNCSAGFGSLAAVIGHLARLTRYALIVEWVAPDDAAIACFGHLNWRADADVGAYDVDTFARELRANFARVESIGEVSSTRRLWVAFTGRHDIDLRCPLPLLHPADTVVSCSRLTVHEGVEYWSRVYDLGDAMQKQTTGLLAAREAAVLERLQGASSPRVLEVATLAHTSTFTMERIDGQPFETASAEIAASEARFRRFVAACLDLLGTLERTGIAHRDIHTDNVLVRDGRPVLIDFGWATAEGFPIFTPEELLRARNRVGQTDVGARAHASDSQAMGAMLLAVCPMEWSIRRLLAVMAHHDPRLRIEDLATLRQLLDARPHAGGDPTVDAASAALLSQIEARDRVIEARDRTIDELRNHLVQAGQHADLDRHTIKGAQQALAHAEATLARRASAEDVADFHAALASESMPRSDRDDLDVAPALRSYALAYAAALRRRGQSTAALHLVTRLWSAIDAKGGDLESWLVATYLRASIQRELGHADAALADFERIIDRGAQDMPIGFLGGALFHSALILEARGDAAAARHRLTRCLEVLPEHSAARSALARLTTP